MILLDASNSMQYGSRKPVKADYARYLAASLLYMAIRHQRDAAGVIVLMTRCATMCSHLRGTGQLARLFASPIRRSLARERIFLSRWLTFRRCCIGVGIVIVISDFYEEPESIVQALESLRYRGNECCLVPPPRSSGDTSRVEESGNPG